VRTLLAHRDARFYLAGQVLSTVGDNALWPGDGHLGEDPHRQQQRRRAGVLRLHLRHPAGTGDRASGRPDAAPAFADRRQPGRRGQGLHRAPAFLGVLEAVMGAGALLGGAFAASVMRRTGEWARAAPVPVRDGRA
jgi:hypothetical protein